MVDKILFFFGGAFYNFAEAKFLHEKLDCDMYAIADVFPQTKKFFENQNFVTFKKIWFFRDNVFVGTSKKPDLNYLENFEKKYGINLWMIAYAERKFFKYNTFYTWKHDEILNILEQECKLYEKILDKCNPDYLIMGLYDQQHLHLLYDICKARKIHIFTLLPTRFGYRYRLGDDEKVFPTEEEEINNNSKTNAKTFEELKNYLKQYDSLKQVDDFNKGVKNISKLKKLKSLFAYFLSTETKFESSFSGYGLSKSKILINQPIKLFKKNRNRNFINKHFTKSIPSNQKFIYFPLHLEPERSLSIAAPYHTNQMEVIISIAKSIPVGYKLFVKDHPAVSLKGGRTISFYKELMKLPNVQVLHPSINRDEILEKCSLVVTINGTAAFEAALFNKHAISLVKTDYSSLPSIHTIKSYEELPEKIHEALGKNVDLSNMNEYVNYVLNHTFDYDPAGLLLDFYARFYNMGIVIPSKEISMNDMQSFMDDHKQTFENIIQLYLKKINQIKKLENITKN